MQVAMCSHLLYTILLLTDQAVWPLRSTLKAAGPILHSSALYFYVDSYQKG